MNLTKCERCRRQLATGLIVGPRVIVRVCASCLAEWRSWVQLVYQREGRTHAGDVAGISG